ncbi:SRPBCC domain-containing protein [Streptomyces sp. NPDC002306]
MTGSVEQGTSVTHGNAHILHFLVRLPVPVERVWPALAGREGLAGWFTEAEVLEPRLGGAVTLRGLGSGQVTAWDVGRVAEYTVEGGGRIRFHLERDGDAGTSLRFTHEFRGAGASEPGWRARFERLIDRLGGPAGTPGVLDPGRC